MPMKTVKIQIVTLDEAECILIREALKLYEECVNLDSEPEHIITAFNEVITTLRRKIKVD